ncbi:hypothetical protein GCM10027443_29770 [Pontibacter brevis]
MFHNDAYLPALGNKHPEALGARARIVWAEVWEELGVVVNDILKGGSPFYAQALPLTLERKGFPEETYWTFSYSPAFNDSGHVNGIFCACSEVTSTVLGERRLKSLKDISEKINQAQTLEQAGQQICDILLQNKEDVPFCLVYLLNGSATTATLLGKAGDTGDSAVPPSIKLAKPGSEWALADVLASCRMTLLDRPGGSTEAGQEKDTLHEVKQVAVLPVMRPGQNQALLGFFIAGISPRLEYNADYGGFHTLLASHIATSITGVQAREELAKQQEYLKEVFQQAPVGIAIVRGPHYVLDLANPEVCQIWGRSPEDVLGKPVIEALPEIADQGVIQLLDIVVDTGEPFIANELPLLLERNGKREKVYLNFIYHPLRNSQGVISGVIAVAIDVSQQVRYRQSVEALNEELVATNADLDNFVYAASHDLRAPISNIEGLMLALVEDLPVEVLESEAVKRVLDLIQGSVNRFKKTVTDLSDVAKIQRQAENDVGNVNLAGIVAEVLLDFEPLIIAADAQIETDLAPDAIFVHFSAKNMRSIVYNLLSNALKYSSPERRPHIRVTAKSAPDHVLLSVKDNGLGMDMAEEYKIFSMFKRLHDHVEGSGVGLYIVKRIVENAGGSIGVESEVGVGSTFSVSFKR